MILLLSLINDSSERILPKDSYCLNHKLSFTEFIILAKFSTVVMPVFANPRDNNNCEDTGSSLDAIVVILVVIVYLIVFFDY